MATHAFRNRRLNWSRVRTEREQLRSVGSTVMRAKGTRRYVVPPIPASRPLLGIEWIIDAVVGPGRFADDEKADVAVRIVDESVADARSCGKADAVAGRQPMEVAVDPGIGGPLDDVDEFLFHAFG